MGLALAVHYNNVLAATTPTWATISGMQRHAFSFSAQVERAGGIKSREYALVARMDAEFTVNVSEQVLGALLPKFCPQRHINRDGTFCLGLRAGTQVATPEIARKWWKKLELFLGCQEASLVCRKWPAAFQLSHGAAGETELEAELVATTLNRFNEYQDLVRYDVGPLKHGLSLYRTDRGVLRNGRAACVCGYVGRHNKAKLRRDCNQNGGSCLLILEQRRREQERQFWKSYAGEQCCGTIDDCPLRRA